MLKDELENKVSLALCLESSSAKKLGDASLARGPATSGES